MNVLTVVPAYNAAKTLLSLLNELNRVTENILVIDDGSEDDTSALCRRAGVPFITHPENMGLSAAMRTAFDFASAERYTHLLALDADLQHSPAVLPDFVVKATKCDLVIGNRFQFRDYIPSPKIASNLFASCIFETLHQRFIPDVACGFRCYRVAAFIELAFGDNFQFIFRTLRHALVNQLSIALTPVPAIYPASLPLVTRRQEVLNLLLAMEPEHFSSELKEVYRRAEDSLDFRILLEGIEFYAWYQQSLNAYCFQVDLQQAEAKYEAQ